MQVRPPHEQDLAFTHKGVCVALVDVGNDIAAFPEDALKTLSGAKAANPCGFLNFNELRMELVLIGMSRHTVPISYLKGDATFGYRKHP